jgi:hypothetical protein
MGRKSFCLANSIGDGFDVAVRVAGGDDDDVSDIGEMPYVHDFDVDGFHVIERGIDDAQQGLRDGGFLGLRGGAAGTGFSGHCTPVVKGKILSGVEHNTRTRE